MEYELNKLSQLELQILFQGLGELPMKVGLNLFSKLQAQIAAQDEKNAVPLGQLTDAPSA